MRTLVQRFVIGASALVVVAAAALQVGGAGTAVAASCAFDQPSATASVFMAGEDIAIVRSGDAITVGGLACGDATVLNTDLITVTGSPGDEILRISLAGGPFAPGFTHPIDFQVDLGTHAAVDYLSIVGSAGPDVITWGDAGINLGADVDADITSAGDIC
jgi:hypothetical protein